MTDDLWRLDATELARLIRLGRASSREATESCLSRLRAVNPAINAVVRALEEEALATADAADRAQARGDTLGPLHGVPAHGQGQHRSSGLCHGQRRRGIP
jgi:amidase